MAQVNISYQWFKLLKVIIECGMDKQEYLTIDEISMDLYIIIYWIYSYFITIGKMT